MEYRGCRERCSLNGGSTPTLPYFTEMKTAISLIARDRIGYPISENLDDLHCRTPITE